MLLKDILGGLIDRLGLTGRVSAASALTMWEKAAGPEISRRTSPSRVVDGTLYIDVDSPAWASQLTYMKQDLLERLNMELLRDLRPGPDVQDPSGGAPVIKDIRFRSRGANKGRPAKGRPNAVDMLRLHLNKTGVENEDVEAARRIVSGAVAGRLAPVAENALIAHRRLRRAQAMSGWVTCPMCERLYEGSKAHCPFCAAESGGAGSGAAGSVGVPKRTG